MTMQQRWLSSIMLHRRWYPSFYVSLVDYCTFFFLLWCVNWKLAVREQILFLPWLHSENRTMESSFLYLCSHVYLHVTLHILIFYGSIIFWFLNKGSVTTPAVKKLFFRIWSSLWDKLEGRIVFVKEDIDARKRDTVNEGNLQREVPSWIL
jgi:hypothetical protein